MKTYNNIEEVKADIKDGVLKVDDDIEINFNGFEIDADIVCHNIYSKGGRRNITTGNINAKNIDAWNINAGNIDAWNITAEDINAWNINAWNINAWNINAWNINARDITALDINARNINYYAVCFAYKDIKCQSIKSRRKNAKHFCLDGKISLIEQEDDKTEEAINLLKEKGYKITKVL